MEYKHAFRERIASELARDETLRVYFDDWGNRCYLMSHDSGVYFMLEKNTGFEYHDVLLNTNAMKQLGASYLFSAAPIDNAREIVLNLVRDTPFETENSYYAIWVYQVSGNE